MLDAAGILGEAGGAGADGRRCPRSAGYSGRSLLPVLRGGRAAAEHVAVRNELHDLLLAHLGETGDLLAGPGWARRPWRGGAAERPFEGNFTTGYRDRWPSGSFFSW